MDKRPYRLLFFIHIIKSICQFGRFSWNIFLLIVCAKILLLVSSIGVEVQCDTDHKSRDFLNILIVISSGRWDICTISNQVKSN